MVENWASAFGFSDLARSFMFVRTFNKFSFFFLFVSLAIETHEAISNVPIGWNILYIKVGKFYASWAELFFYFLLNLNKEHFISIVVLSYDWQTEGQREREKRSFSCDSSAIRGTRVDFSFPNAELFPLFPAEIVSQRQRTQSSLKLVATVSSRKYGTLCDTSGVWNATNDRYQRLATRTISSEQLRCTVQRNFRTVLWYIGFYFEI